MKTLSVITPVYNRADCIERCIRSVEAQVVPAGWTLQHVITDDGSSDATVELISKHPRVLLELLPQNRGTNAARNAAIRKADGEWIVILDSDDEMLPEAVLIICESIDNNPDFKHFIFATDDTASSRASFGNRHVFSFEDFLLEKVSGDFVHVMRRDTVLEFPFREDLRIHEGIFFLRFYRKVQKILFINKTIYRRDRQRNDHATFELNMTTDRALLTKLAAGKLQVEYFADDYKRSDEGRLILLKKLQNIYKFSILSGNYSEADAIASQIYTPRSYSILRTFHLGPAAWVIIKNIVKLKHR